MNLNQLQEILKEYIKENVLVKKEWIPGKDWVQYAGPYFSEDEYISAITTLLKGWLVHGPESSKFEDEFPKHLGKTKGVLTNSGSSANLLMVSALKSKKLWNLPKGSKIITPVAGFPTTINHILQNDFTPIFIDIELKTLNIDIELLEKTLEKEKDVKAIIFAHVLGNPPNMNHIMDLVNKYKLILLEDCCDAIGSNYANIPLGSFGEMASVSFYPAHHLCGGEGGFVATKTGQQKQVVKSLSNWGRSCFKAGTPIWISNDEFDDPVKIENVEAGTLVLTHKARLRPVKHLIKSEYSGKYMYFDVPDAVFDSRVESTENHKHFIVRKNESIPQWVEAKDIRVGDYFLYTGVGMQNHDAVIDFETILHEDVCYIKMVIQSISSEDYTGTVYNLEVEEDHSYHAWGVATHNCYCSGLKANLSTKGSCGKRFSNWIDGLPEKTFDHKYVFDEIGYNLKPIELQASILLAQVKKLDEIKKKRQDNYKKLYSIFKPYESYFVLPEPTDKADVSWFAFPLTVKKNDKFDKTKFVNYLEENKIQTRPYFGGNLLLQPAYEGLMNKTDIIINYPVATKVMFDTFFLGTSPVITEQQMDYIKEIVDNFFKQ